MKESDNSFESENLNDENNVNISNDNIIINDNISDDNSIRNNNNIINNNISNNIPNPQLKPEAKKGKKKISRSNLKARYGKLRKRIRDILTTEQDLQRYDEFVMWLDRLNELSEQFYTLGEDGSLPVVDKLSMRALLQTYASAMEAATHVIRMNSEGEISRNMKELAEEVHMFLSMDKAALEMAVEQADKNPMTLSEIVGRGRSGIMDAGNSKLTYAHGALSKRIPVKVKGTDIDGFFTPKNKIGYKEKLNKLCDEFKQKYPSLADVFEMIKGKERLYLFNIGKHDLHKLLIYFANFRQIPNDNPQLIKDGVKYGLRKLLCIAG